VRKEIIQQSGAYWYGYRSVQRRTIKRYPGRRADLSLARLEEMTEHFTDAAPMPISAPGQAATTSTRSHISRWSLAQVRYLPCWTPSCTRRAFLYSFLNESSCLPVSITAMLTK
jgi:hypothetical protein